jgi:hypothetical protein
MPQTSYSASQGTGFPGQLSDLSGHRGATAVNKQGTAIPFGVGVTKASGEGEYRLPALSTEKVNGFALHSHDVDQRDLTGTEGIPIDAKFTLLTEGCLYVTVEETVVQGDPVFVRFGLGTAAGQDQRGAVRKSADTIVAWQNNHAYTLGQRCENDTGKLYQVITAGTSDGAGGPTGTGTDITDGTVHWRYVGAAAAGASAAVVKGAQFRRGATAGGIAEVQFSKLVNLS